MRYIFQQDQEDLADYWESIRQQEHHNNNKSGQTTRAFSNGHDLPKS